MTQPDPRSPRRLRPDDVATRVQAAREHDDVHRIYARQWLIVHADTSAKACQVYYDRAYTDRVRPSDMRIQRASANAYGEVWHLYLYLPVLRGEFTTAALAEGYAQTSDLRDYEIVVRNSARDHEIRTYSITKLAT